MVSLLNCLSAFHLIHSILREGTKNALSGQRVFDGPIEKSLTARFELLNLVPATNHKPMKSYYSPDTFRNAAGKEETNSSEPELTKWRPVGLVSGTNVHLDTIVWPGGDIVVSGT